jgi:hypothetical protein
MAPEYAVLGHLSVKLDVYSFGVLILEVVTGRRNTDMFESAAGESIILLSYVSPLPIVTLRSLFFFFSIPIKQNGSVLCYLGVGPLGQGHRAGGRRPVPGLPLPGTGGGGGGGQVHPSGAALRAGEPGGPPQHARRPRHAPRPLVRLRGTVQAGFRLCLRGDHEF